MLTIVDVSLTSAAPCMRIFPAVLVRPGGHRCAYPAELAALLMPRMCIVPEALMSGSVPVVGPALPCLVCVPVACPAACAVLAEMVTRLLPRARQALAKNFGPDYAAFARLLGDESDDMRALVKELNIVEARPLHTRCACAAVVLRCHACGWLSLSPVWRRMCAA